MNYEHADNAWEHSTCREHDNCLLIRARPDAEHATGITEHHFRPATALRRRRRPHLGSHDVFMLFEQERRRAHTKHAEDSIEEKAWDDPGLYATWVEEAMETVQAWTDMRHGKADMDKLEKELVQLGAMTVAWLQAIRDHRASDDFGIYVDE